MSKELSDVGRIEQNYVDWKRIWSEKPFLATGILLFFLGCCLGPSGYLGYKDWKLSGKIDSQNEQVADLSGQVADLKDQLREAKQERDTAQIRLDPFIHTANSRYGNEPEDKQLALLLNSLTNQLQEIDVKVDTVLATLKVIDWDNKPEFQKEFPLGYTLLTLTSPIQSLPFSDDSSIQVNWNGCRVHGDGDRITFALPTIILKSSSTSLVGNAISFPEKVGAEVALHFSIYAPPAYSIAFGNVISLGGMTNSLNLHPNPTHSVVVKLVASKHFGDVLLLGVRPYTPRS